MANLTDTPTWEPGVFRLEANTPAQGGPGGPMNAQAQALANRTTYLKAEVEERLPLAGGQMTGHPEFPDDGSLPLEAATRRYAAQTRMHNRIINPWFLIDQRGNAAGIAAPASGIPVFPVDRWRAMRANGSAISLARAYDATRGHHRLRATVTAPAALTAPDWIVPFAQAIEGLNVADLGWGTAAAKPVVLTFPFRATVAGTYTATIRNHDATRRYVATFSSPVANQWQDVEIAIPGDTGGSWQRDHALGLDLFIGAVSGANGHAAAAGVWGAGSAFSLAAATPWHLTNGAALDIGPVQLERGTTATDPEFRPFTVELALCQRYAFALAGPITNGSVMVAMLGHTFNQRIAFPATMRVSPTATGLTYSNNINCIAAGLIEISPDGATFFAQASGSTNGGAQITLAAGLFDAEF